jgi:hypothetical protein
MTHQETVTDYDAKMTMIKAERRDEILLEPVDDVEMEIPSTVTVARRTETYFGPKLLLYDESAEQNWLLTAPGPESQLHLWPPQHADDGLRRGWMDPIEVTADVDATTQYPICSRCGEPLKTLQHEREAAFGLCTGDSE